MGWSCTQNFYHSIFAMVQQERLSMVEGVVEWFLTTHTLYEQSLVFKPPLCWKSMYIHMVPCEYECRNVLFRV